MPVVGNVLLRSLPAHELERLRPYLRDVPLACGQRIYRAGEPLGAIWFPQDGAASRLIQLQTGETVEAGIFGSDGVIGMRLVLRGQHGLGQCTVEIEGTALMMSVHDFNAHVRERGGPLYEALLMHADLYIAILGRLTACHCLHPIEQRLSRCILTLTDYGSQDCVRVTHDTLAAFLGVHRPSVTYALQALAHAGAVESERRRIAIVDRRTLLERACGCYQAIRTLRSQGRTA